MIEIERLHLGLPATLARRADRISQLVGETLADTSAGQNLRIDALHIGPLRIDAQRTDRQIARQIARAIERQLPGGPSV